ncbi:hypothetical protein CEK62_04185 [Alcanivorax sp. N3-2A]|nr:hypothetical protein CEK62_04185 [Alcanivorax sp. N3-2A]
MSINMDLSDLSTPGDPTSYKSWWAGLSANLGGIYPFFDSEDPCYFSLDINDVLKRKTDKGEGVELDLAALVSKTTLPYILGDQTLVKGVKRAPWMCQLSKNGAWSNHSLPLHGFARPEPEEFERILREALLKEARTYLDGCDTVGLLLSGGMDSRIVAGVVRQLQLDFGVPKRVIALTWGMENSRDVHYAKDIAKRFSWEFEHFPLGAEILKDNIDFAGLAGAEVAPIHLHAIPQLAKIDNIDVFLAGSYGDSVGRAEFSGKKLERLGSILPKNFNRYGLVRSSLMHDILPAIRANASLPSEYGQLDYIVRRHEIEQQKFYLRRMLQCNMGALATNAKFFQLFTSPDVFGLMWGLAPSQRNDTWYSLLLQNLPGDLLSLPWARTGVPFGDDGSRPDGLRARYHMYGVWLRSDLFNLIYDRVKSPEIRNLGIFNDKALDRCLRVWRSSRTESNGALDEIMSWLASLHVFITHNHFEVTECYPSSLRDRFTADIGYARAKTYTLARNWLRK